MTEYFVKKVIHRLLTKIIFASWVLSVAFESLPDLAPRFRAKPLKENAL